MYLLEEEYSAKWKLDGETFTLDESGLTYEGTLKDGVLTIDFFGMVYTFEKEGTSTTASGTSTSEPQEIGYWTLLRVDSDSADESMSEEDVALFKDLGIEFYADLKADGTGVLVFDDPVNFTWANGQITCETGEKCSYSLTDDLLHMDDMIFCDHHAHHLFRRGKMMFPCGFFRCLQKGCRIFFLPLKGGDKGIYTRLQGCHLLICLLLLPHSLFDCIQNCFCRLSCIPTGNIRLRPGGKA